MSAIVAVAAWVAATSTGDDATANSNIVGAWQSTDTDGSTQWLWVEPIDSDTLHITYYDEGASGCDESLEVPALIIDSSVPVSGDTVNFAPTTGALCLFPDREVELSGTLSITYTHDPVSDTVTDSLSEVTWQRLQADKESITGG